MAPGLREVAVKYSITNSTILALTLSVYLLSFAIGVSGTLPPAGGFTPSDNDLYKPLILAPLSEMYGRTWVRAHVPPSIITLNFLQVLHIANIFSLAFNLGCAFAPNTGALIAFRFLGQSIIEIAVSLALNLFGGVSGFLWRCSNSVWWRIHR